MALKNCNYNKIKVLHDIHSLKWFIDNHAISDAKKDGHPLCAEMFKELSDSLDKMTHKPRLAVEGLSKEGKFQ